MVPKPLTIVCEVPHFLDRFLNCFSGDAYAVPHLVDVGKDVGVSDYSAI